MALITCTGKLINTFKANPTRDRETQQLIEGKDKIQIMGDSVMQDGSKRALLQDFTCHDLPSFKQYLGKEIRFEIGIMSAGDTTILYIPKGTVPELVQPATPKAA